MEELFDRAEEYEAMLQRGIGLSGENQQFLVVGRIRDLEGAPCLFYFPEPLAALRSPEPGQGLLSARSIHVLGVKA